MTPGPREWDAEEYESLARPQDAWGLRILGMLDLNGDETVLEAGCGTGRDTERLLKLLPHGREAVSSPTAAGLGTSHRSPPQWSR